MDGFYHQNDTLYFNSSLNYFEIRGFILHASVTWGVQHGPNSQRINCKTTECKGHEVCKKSWGNSQEPLNLLWTKSWLRNTTEDDRNDRSNRRRKELDSMVASLVKERLRWLLKSYSGQRPPSCWEERYRVFKAKTKVQKANSDSQFCNCETVHLKSRHQADSCFFWLILCKNALEIASAHFNQLLKNTSEFSRRLFASGIL